MTAQALSSKSRAHFRLQDTESLDRAAVSSLLNQLRQAQLGSSASNSTRSWLKPRRDRSQHHFRQIQHIAQEIEVEDPAISPQTEPPEELDPPEPTEPPSEGAADLDSGANPLLFPTDPDEVDIETVQPITLEQAVEVAQQNNRELQISRLQLQQAREQLREARAALFPTLDFDFTISRSDSPQSQLSVEQQDTSGITFGDSFTPGTDTGTIGGGTPGTDGPAATLRAPQTAGGPGTGGNGGDGGNSGPDADESDGETTDDGPVTPTAPSGAGDITDTDDIDTAQDSITGSLVLNYQLYTGGLRPAQIRAAERQVRFNELDVERLSEETRLEVATEYYNLQNTEAQVNIEQAAVDDATQTLRDAQLLEQAGLGTRFDVLRAEVELANANQNLLLALADQRTARRQLAETLSVGPNIELTTADEIEEAGTWNFTLPETIVLAFQNRAELEQSLVQREIDRQEREIALSAIRPQVSLFASYDVAEDLDDADTGFEDGYSVGATLQWRLFDGGAARARANQEETDVEIDEATFANQRDEVRLEVEDAYFSLQANARNIETSERAVELAEESLRLARLRFQAGVGTQTDVIDAQTELTTARGNFLNAIITYNQSFSQLQRAVSNIPDNLLFDLP